MPGRVLGQSSDLVTLRFDAAKLLRINQRYTGYFRSGAIYQAMREVHTGVAVQLQQAMVDKLNDQIGPREQRPGQRLEVSLLSENNREVYANTFSVGLTGWLEKSPAAAYYRAIDTGRSGYDAYVLFFGPGGLTRPNEGFNQMRMPQFRNGRGVLVHVKSFAGYHYSRAAGQTYRSIDMFDRYRQAFAPLGIDLTKDKGDFVR